MSKSSIIEKRKAELKKQQKSLESDLGVKGNRVGKIVLWALGIGLLAFLGYKIYSAFSGREDKPGKRESGSAAQSPKSQLGITIAEYILPRMIDWVMNYLKNRPTKR